MGRLGLRLPAGDGDRHAAPKDAAAIAAATVSIAFLHAAGPESWRPSDFGGWFRNAP